MYVGSRLKRAWKSGRRHLKSLPSSRTGENPPYGMIGGGSRKRRHHSKPGPRLDPTRPHRDTAVRSWRTDLFATPVKGALRLLAHVFPIQKPVALARSADACERGADAFWRPSFDRRRRRAGRNKVRTLALAQYHLLTRRAHRYRAARGEHAERPVARPGEESRAAYRDQREGAANLHRRARAARRSIE